MIITGDDEEEIYRFQKKLNTEFETKNMGGIKYFLKIEVARSRQGIFISQRNYVLDLLTEIGMLERANQRILQSFIITDLKEYSNKNLWIKRVTKV